MLGKFLFDIKMTNDLIYPFIYRYFFDKKNLLYFLFIYQTQINTQKLYNLLDKFQLINSVTCNQKIEKEENIKEDRKKRGKREDICFDYRLFDTVKDKRQRLNKVIPRHLGKYNMQSLS